MFVFLLIWASVDPELNSHLPMWSTVDGPCLTEPLTVLELQHLLGPISEHDDPFDSDPLDPSWEIINPGNYLREFASGRLILTPTGYTQWYQAENSGGFLSKRIQGNIKITARIRARSANNPSLPVTGGPFQLGGLMLRNPDSVTENYVFVAVGLSGGILATETKTTINSTSTFQGEAWGTGDAELRLCRIGARFYLYARPIGGGAWQAATASDPFFDRPDLPWELMAGPIAYGPTASPDLQAEFEEIVFEPAFSECDCTTD